MRTPPTCQDATRTSRYHPCVRTPPMCQGTTHVSEHHVHCRTPPTCQDTTPMSIYHPCIRTPPVWAGYCPCVRTRPVCQNTIRVSRYHPCVPRSFVVEPTECVSFRGQSSPRPSVTAPCRLSDFEGFHQNYPGQAKGRLGNYKAFGFRPLGKDADRTYKSGVNLV